MIQKPSKAIALSKLYLSWLKQIPLCSENILNAHSGRSLKPWYNYQSWKTIKSYYGIFPNSGSYTMTWEPMIQNSYTTITLEYLKYTPSFHSGVYYKYSRVTIVYLLLIAWHCVFWCWRLFLRKCWLMDCITLQVIRKPYNIRTRDSI